MEAEPKRIKIIYRALALIMVLTIMSNLSILYAKADNIGGISSKIPEPELTIDFSNNSDITLNDDASIDNGSLVLTGKADSYAVYNGDISTLGLIDSITISIDASAVVPFGSYNYMLFTLGSNTDQLYIRASRNTLAAGIIHGNLKSEVTGPGLSNNVFKNIVMTYTYDPEAKGTLSIFVNGLLGNRISGIDIPLGSIVNVPDCTVLLGKSLQNGINGYNGKLDNLKIWNTGSEGNKVLTARQIAALNGLDLEAAMEEIMDKDLAYLKTDTDTTSKALYYDQRIHDPVVHDVLLWQTGKISGNRITWTSSNENLLSIFKDANGNDYSAKLVTPPERDTKVTLTATIHIPDPDGGEFTKSKDLEVTVLSLESRRQADYDALEITNMNDVRDNLPFIVAGKYGSRISWTSSNPDVITDTGDVTDAKGNVIFRGGIVTRPEPGEDPVDVTITAEVTYPGVEGSLTKTFNVKVTPKSGEVQKELDHYLFVYYAENNDWDRDGIHKEEIYMGVSRDGIKWNDLNVKTRDYGTRYTKPVLISMVGDMGTRDPHIVRSPDGDKFYIMCTNLHAIGTALYPNYSEDAKDGYGATGNNFDCISGNRDIVVWSTNDLTKLEDTPGRLVKCNFDSAGNTYAPEAIWDEKRGAYLVYWSSNNNDFLGDDGLPDDTKKGGIYYCYTRDFITFTEPQLWYSYVDVASAYPEYGTNKFDVYDTHIAYDETTKTYYRFATTNRLFVQTSNDLMGPWSEAHKLSAVANSANIEAPTTYQLPDGRWMLLGDNYRVYVPYVADTLNDFITGNYERTDLDYPANRANPGDTFPRYKHGTIIRISAEEYDELIAAYGIDAPATEITCEDSVEPGETFNAQIFLNTAGKNVYAEDITLSYDPEIFEYINTTSVDDNIKILRNETSNGTVRIVAANIGGLSGSDVPVLNVSLKVKSGVESTSSTISVSKATLGIMPEGKVLQADLSSKTIAVGFIPGVDKSALRFALEAAESLYDSAVVGIENGCYWQADKDAFKAAIDTAKAVYEDSNASQLQVDNAVDALNAAKAAFEASVITPSTGDINNSSTIDVGDLATVAYFYGLESGDPNWVEAVIADINKDGKISIEDLAFIASRM